MSSGMDYTKRYTPDPGNSNYGPPDPDQYRPPSSPGQNNETPYRPRTPDHDGSNPFRDRGDRG